MTDKEFPATLERLQALPVSVDSKGRRSVEVPSDLFDYLLTFIPSTAEENCGTCGLPHSHADSADQRDLCPGHSETPRTDAAVNVAHSDGYSLCEPQVVHAWFARQLERELAEAVALKRRYAARCIELQSAPSSTAMPITEEFSEFIGRLSDLAHTSSFWEDKPYSNRLYYGIGNGDYIAKDILHSFLHALKLSRSAKEALSEEDRRTISSAALQLMHWTVSRNKEPYANTAELARRLEAIVRPSSTRS